MPEYGDVVVGDMAVVDRAHFAIAKVQASEHVVFIEVKLSSVGSDYAAVAPCFRKIEREVELDQFTARGLQLFNGDVTAIREREHVRAVTTPPRCCAACTGPKLDPMAKMVNKYRSAARSSLGSEPDAGPKCWVNLVRCSTLTRMSSRLRCGIRRINSRWRRWADSGMVRALYLCRIGMPSAPRATAVF